MAITEFRKKFASQTGGSLLAVMILMTIIAFFLMIAAPELKQDIQREKELEAIRRGEEVAEAIRQYVVFYNCAKLPNSIDDLLEGLPYGTKKRAILRVSAAIDPLSPDGKWKLFQPKPNSVAQFAKRVQKYNNGALPDSPNKQCFDRYVIQGRVNTESEESNEESADETDDDSGSESENVPFIGVVSKSKSKSVVAYYGIENHSKWVFTPLFRGTGISQTGIRNSNTGTSIIPSDPEDKPRDDR